MNKTHLIAITATVVVVVGIASYANQDKKLPTEVVETDIPAEVAELSTENIDTPTEETEQLIENTDEDTVSETGSISCGTNKWSEFEEARELKNMEFEKNASMVCMGNNLLDNCKKASSVVIGKEGEFTSYKILGSKDGMCIVRMEHIDGGAPLPEDQKFLKGMYAECPMDLEDLISGAGRDVSKTPGLFAAEIHLLAAFETMMDETTCTGTWVDAYQAEQAKNN